MRTGRWAHPLLPVAFAAASCGHSGVVGQQPSWRRGAGGEAGEEASQPRRTVEFAPLTPEADHYNGAAPRQVTRAPISAEIIAAVKQASAALGRPAPRADERLFAAAQDLADVVPADAPLAYGLVEFALQRNGIIEPSPHLVVIWGSADESESIVGQLRERLGKILGSADFVRLGVGAARRGDDGDVTIVAFQASYISTAPIPRSVPKTGVVVLSGRVLPPYSSPQLYITHGDGSVDHAQLTAADGGRFESKMSCEGRVGRQQVEITASDDSGSTVLANFPVWCGEFPPSSIVVDLTEDHDTPFTSEEDAERRMLGMINEARTRLGLSDLTMDLRLTDIARRHSLEMMTTGVVAHVSNKTGTAADRVRNGGVRTSLVLENVARAYGIGEAHDGLMNSPGHRANILASDATHAGVGIVLGKGVSGRRELFVTQLFTRVPEEIDVELVRAQVLEVVRAARALPEDAALSEVAGQFASDVAGGMGTPEATKRASARIDQSAKHFARVSTLIATVADVGAFDPRATLQDRRITHFGVGIAQGDHEVMGEDSIYIVLLLGGR